MKHSLLQTVSALAFTALVATAMPGASFAGVGINVATVEQLEADATFKAASPAEQEAMRTFVKNALADPAHNGNSFTSGGYQLNVGPQYGPGGGTAAVGTGPGIYLPDATSAQITEALKNTPNFNFAAEEAKQYAILNAQYGKPVKDAVTGAVLTSPTAEQSAAWDKKLHDQAYMEASKVQSAWQDQMAAVGLMATNKAGEETLNKQQARDAAWKAAANAALAKLTADAVTRGIDQANYDNLINKALEELYAARLYYEADEHYTIPIPSPLPTPLANTLLGQMQSQKAYAAAHPEVCIPTPTSAGNPAACGIVDKRLTVDTPQSSLTKVEEPYLAKKVEIVTAAIPPEGKVNVFSVVKGGATYTIDSNGVVKDSTGKIIGAVDKAGNTYDKDLKLVSDPNGNFISMLSVGRIDSTNIPPTQFTKSTTNPAGVSLASTGGGSGGGGGNAGSDAYPAVRQQNTYSARDDNGEIVY